MIDADLYRRLFAELAAIGRGPGGWNRMAWGPGEDAARDWFRATRGGARARGRAGPGRATSGRSSRAARTARSTPSARIVDSVADGGAFDGALGVVAGLVAVEAARRARRARRGRSPSARMVDEEGPRFGAAIFGSRALVRRARRRRGARAHRSARATCCATSRRRAA